MRISQRAKAVQAVMAAIRDAEDIFVLKMASTVMDRGASFVAATIGAVDQRKNDGRQRDFWDGLSIRSLLGEPVSWSTLECGGQKQSYEVELNGVDVEVQLTRTYSRPEAA